MTNDECGERNLTFVIRKFVIRHSAQGCSSIGRAPVSKTGGCEFESHHPCHSIVLRKGRGVGAIVQELFRVGLYKRNQGRVARQATFAALAIIVALGAWSLSEYLGGIVSEHPSWNASTQNFVRYIIPLLLLAAGVWASFRVVQMPTFADFLISVEGEMNKVSWPSRDELFRASVVVMVVIFFLAALLFCYDLVLTELLKSIDRLVTWIFG